MKKIFVLVLSSLLLPGWAQTLDDVELFNTRGLHGTPRFVGMGGAFTALGNDLTSIHLNPAGVAVFRNDNLGLSLGLQTTGSDQSFYGGNSYQTSTNLLFENVGLVKKFEVGGYGNETKLAFSIGYNKLADFNRSYSVTGENTIGPYGEGSLAEYWFLGADQLYPDELSSMGLFEELAAYQAYVLVTDTATDLISEGVAFGNGVNSQNADIQYQVNESGSRSEASLSFGGEFNSNFYYGVSLGFPTLSYRKEDYISELNLPHESEEPYDATSYTFRRLNEIYANGINIKVGAILKPAPWIRLGAAYESPTWYTVSQAYEFDVTANFSDGFQGLSDIFSTGDYTYKLKTPSIYRLGAAFIFGQQGLISIDYDFSDPSKTNTYMGGRNSDNIAEADLNVANNDITSLMTSTNTFKIGGEYRLGFIMLRAGYNFRSSFYKDPQEYKSDIETISGGIGYQNQSFGIDLTYSNSQFMRKDFVHPFAAELVDAKATLSNVLLGVTFRF